MQAKEIIILTTTLGNDGAERILTELSNEWVRTGNKVIVVQTGINVDASSYVLDKRVEKINIHVERKNRIQWYLKEVKEFIRVLNGHKNATVLAFLSRSFYLAYFASFFVKNRIVFSERNDPTRWPAKWYSRKFRDFVFCKADACVFQTREALEHFPQKAKRKGVIIPNPCNPNLPERYMGERRKVIISASRLTKQKNLPMLINAFEKLHKEYPEYKLEIYGEGEERSNIEELVKVSGLSDCILLPGFAKNIHNIMIDSSMYVCSSDYEGISNSMLEALGMGVPTISTDCPVGGAREIIKSWENGILVPVGDVDALYDAMKNIISDSDLSSRLSENAYLIRSDYRIERIAKQWLKVLQK